MQYRIQVVLRASTQSDANSVASRIAGPLSNRPSVTPVSPPVVGENREEAFWEVRATVDYATRANVETVRDLIQTEWTGNSANARRILAGSWATIHDCRHDEDPSSWVDCGTQSLVRAVK